MQSFLNATPTSPTCLRVEAVFLKRPKFTTKVKSEGIDMLNLCTHTLHVKILFLFFVGKLQIDRYI